MQGASDQRELGLKSEQIIVNKISGLTSGFVFNTSSSWANVDHLLRWLTETETQQWFTVCEVQILQLPWRVLAEILRSYQIHLGNWLKNTKDYSATSLLYYSRAVAFKLQSHQRHLGSLQNSQSLGHLPDQSNQNLWGWHQPPVLFEASQMILIGTQD